jgi:hypothetical protein
MTRSRRITPAGVLALIALVLALAGGAFAAKPGKKLPKDSVTSKQVVDGSLTGADVADGSLSPSDFSGSVAGPQGPAGPQVQRGPAGPQGELGPQGPMGSAGVVQLQRVQADRSIPANAGTSAEVACPAGKSPIAGGYEVIGSPMQIKGSFPANTAGSSSQPLNGWSVPVFNNNGSAQTLRVYAVCATVNGGFPNPGA